MRYRIPAALTLCLGLLAPTSAMAENPSFDFVELRLGQVAVKDVNVSDTGAQLGFSWGFSDSFSFFAESGEFGDLAVWRSGFGWRKETSEQTTLYLLYGHFSADDGTLNADGKSIELGVRNRYRENLEIGASIEHRDADGLIEEVRFGVDLRYYTSDRISFGLSADAGADTNEYALSARVDFGG